MTTSPDGPGDPLSYETSAPNAYTWTAIAFDLLTGDKLSASVKKAGGIQTAVVHGGCPRCGHEFNFSQVLDAVSGESFRTPGKRTFERTADFIPLTVSCRCTEPHPGRPAEFDHGCGINFRVDVMPDAG